MAQPPRPITFPAGMGQQTPSPPIMPRPPRPGETPADENGITISNVTAGRPETVDMGNIGPGGYTPPGQMTPEMDQAAQQTAMQNANQVADQAMQEKYGSNLVGAAQTDLAKAQRQISGARQANDETLIHAGNTAEGLRELGEERTQLEAPVYSKAEAALQAEQQRYQQQRERVQRAVDKQTADVDAAVQEYSATRITSWWDQADTGTKIFATLATAFQSAAEAMQGKFGGTTAIERIINADMERQKLQMQLQEKKISQKQTLLGSLRDQLGSMDSAMVAFQNIASNSIKFQVQAISSKLGTKEAQVKADQLIMEQDDKIAQRNAALAGQSSNLFTTKAQMEQNTKDKQDQLRQTAVIAQAKLAGKQEPTLSFFEGTENMDKVNRRKLGTIMGYGRTNINTLNDIESLLTTNFKGMKPLEALAVLDTLATMHGLNYNLAKGITRFNQKEFDQLHKTIASLSGKVNALTGVELPGGGIAGLKAAVRLMRADLKSNISNLATSWRGVRATPGGLFDLSQDDRSLLATSPTPNGDTFRSIVDTSDSSDNTDNNTNSEEE